MGSCTSPHLPWFLSQGTPGRQSSSSPARSDASAQSSIPAESQGSAGTLGHQLHDWVPQQAPGREGFQAGGTGMGVVGQLADPSETVLLSGRDSVEGAEELWAAMGPTTAFWLDLPEQLDSSADAAWATSPICNGEELLSDENKFEVAERRRWQEWAKHAAEHERQRRMKVRISR